MAWVWVAASAAVAMGTNMGGGLRTLRNVRVVMKAVAVAALTRLNDFLSSKLKNFPTRPFSSSLIELSDVDV